MGMVVECSSCMTEYRLNEALLKGAKRAWIRCPRCRERISVENPQAPLAAPAITQRVTPPVVTPPITPRVEPPAAPSVTHRSTPSVVTPPIAHRVKPAVAPPIPQRVPAPSATPIAHRVPPPIGSTVPPVQYHRWRPLPCRGSRPRPYPRSHRRLRTRRSFPLRSLPHGYLESHRRSPSNRGSHRSATQRRGK